MAWRRRGEQEERQEEGHEEKEADEMANLILSDKLENSKKFVSYEKAVDSISPNKS